MDTAATGTSWSIATPHTLATEAGAAAFDRGGNAIDAALWAATTLAVTYPHMCGVGGDLFALVRHAAGTTVGINASGRSPAGLDPDVVRVATGGPMMPERGPFTVTVPGAVSGWEALHAQGATLPWADAFTQAVALAYGGVAVSRSLAQSLRNHEAIAEDPGLRAVFFVDGRPLAEGEPLRQPALGGTLQSIASLGPDCLYGGDIGGRLVDGLHGAGVPITIDDLAAHGAELTAPLWGRYRDHDVLVAPPNSQGFVLQEILSIVERLQIDPDPFGGDAISLARVISAAGLDRDRHLADPERMRTHVSSLMSDGHLAALADEVRDGGAASVPGSRAPHGGDTIALVTADRDGSAVSLIQSLFDGFGSQILEPSTGIVAQDRGGCFTLEPGHVNELAPGRRPLHTLMPVLVQRDGEFAAAAGTMGGFDQPQINAMTLIRALDLGSTPQEAVSAPRWLAEQPSSRAGARSVTAEADVPAAVVDRFGAEGYGVDLVEALGSHVGHAHLIRRLPDGFEVGSDPRADGGALAG